MSKMKEIIESGKAVLGIEFGSTRIKAVLIGEDNTPIASGAHDWENRLENGIWTYSPDDIWTGLRDSYTKMTEDVKKQYDAEVTSLAAIGFSAMMHGYMVFDKGGELLVPFRTWRNTITEPASEQLTELFQYHIPQRWSIAHLDQCILNGDEHVAKIDYLVTLAGYIHWQLTGERVLGVGEASGMFPIDIATGDYNQQMIDRFDQRISEKGYAWKLRDILPKVLSAGDAAGNLTEEGAKKLDVSGKLQAGIPVCPPEGDAGTGMVATNSVAVRTGNVSAGTSVFGMVVMEKELSKVYEEIDLVTTPTGNLVGMVHCNNCTSDLNAWVNLFKEFAESFGMKVDMNELFGTLYKKALEGDKNCGGLLAYNYFSGEHVTKFEEGRPLFVRKPDSNFNLANFMRVHLMASLSVLKTGLNLMLKQEGVKVDKMLGHGGLFKTKGVGQSILAAAIDAPVFVMETAGEGGAWGIALLASYMVHKEDGESLDGYLNNKVFAGQEGTKMDPDPADVKGFDEFLKTYAAGLPIERAAVDHMA
uniref:Carbohydrate kinase FGGY N-terminal domain-containing protein n=1 Tax=Eubacterium plexicaudatum ASF492 TaxID=1235802 RepID=N2AEN5_9FIRM